MSPFEILMLICFGAAWPFSTVSILIAYRTRYGTTERYARLLAELTRAS
jgi:hypothetical protein